MMQSVDIAIIGGGMVGLSLALALKDSDLRVAVIEGKDPNLDLTEIPDNRVSALSRSSEVILKKLGVWQGITNRRCAPYQAMEVWEKDSFAKIDFRAEQLSQPNLGHIVENRVVQAALMDRLMQQDNVSYFSPVQCQSVAVGEGEAWLSLNNGQTLTAKLVVGADGAHSWLRTTQNIPLTQWDYGQNSIVATVQTAQSHDHIARQVFTPSGPLAFLPLADVNLCSIVWSTDEHQAEQLMNCDIETFNRRLSSEFDLRLGLCEVVGERNMIPLKMRYARSFAKDRIALVGDAAHTIHPLAGQGVNLGLLDAASLAQEVLALWQQGEDIGRLKNLRHYERWRKSEAAKMIATMQGFKELFSGANPAKKWLRGVGMNLTAHLPGAKGLLMNRALGLSGELPALAQEK